MACQQVCKDLRPDNFQSELDNYDNQIENYTNMASEFNALARDLTSDVVNKINDCGLSNLEMAINSSDIVTLTDNIKQYRDDMIKQCEEYKKMAKEAEQKKQELTTARKNYYNTAWVKQCTYEHCYGSNY